tara:strand:+ start:100 stop:384 length:285 start_codon:yes stop_codon:yes gene_type:complete
LLTAEDIKAQGAEIEITNEAEMKDTKFGTKLFVGVKLSNGEERMWIANNTSMNHLIETLGGDSVTWLGKKCELETVKSQTSGGLKDVIYAMGSV